MDSLADLLARRKPDEPPEIKAIKDYIQHHFGEVVAVMVRERDIVVTVRSSALSGALRMHTHHIQQLLQDIAGNVDSYPQRQIVYRVGSLPARP